MHLYDLIVIGGGPAGTSTAISAARSGASVLLLERGRFPATKCAANLSRLNLSRLLINLLDRHDTTLLQDSVPISQARVFLDGRVLRTAVDPPAASIARLDLDAVLWHSAEAAGVHARQQVTVQSIEGSSRLFRVATKNETV